MNNDKSDHERQRARLVMRVILAAGAVLALAAPVGAHGSAGDQIAGPVAGWLVLLVYLELAAVPVIAFLLLRQARDAWLAVGTQKGGDSS